eukprot:9162773-Karenia_brevis.AAC.1
MVKLTLIHKFLEKAHNSDKNSLERHRRQAKDAAMLADPTRKAAYRKIKGNAAPVLTALRTSD